MPSDHAVKDEARFVEAVRRAAGVAATGRLVLFGIEPDAPHTGYGYIKRGTALEGFRGGAFAVDAFCEKPDTETAEGYLAEGGYYWNSGIFVLNARTYLDEVARFDPGMLEEAAVGARRSRVHTSGDGVEEPALALFEALP